MWFLFASTTFGIVPADLQSAGIEYQDLFNPITSYLMRLQIIKVSAKKIDEEPLDIKQKCRPNFYNDFVLM